MKCHECGTEKGTLIQVCKYRPDTGVGEPTGKVLCMVCYNKREAKR